MTEFDDFLEDPYNQGLLAELLSKAIVEQLSSQAKASADHFVDKHLPDEMKKKVPEDFRPVFLSILKQMFEIGYIHGAGTVLFGPNAKLDEESPGAPGLVSLNPDERYL